MEPKRLGWKLNGFQLPMQIIQKKLIAPLWPIFSQKKTAIPVLLPHLPCNRFPIHHFCFPRGGGLAFPPPVRSRAVSSAESGHASHCGEGTQPHQVILIADKYTRHDSDGQNLGLKGPDHFTRDSVLHGFFHPTVDLKGRSTRDFAKWWFGWKRISIGESPSTSMPLQQDVLKNFIPFLGAQYWQHGKPRLYSQHVFLDPRLNAPRCPVPPKKKVQLIFEPGRYKMRTKRL